MFDRSRTGVCLTEAGSHLYDAVSSGLDTIHHAIVEAGEATGDEHVTIACPHDAWQLVFVPRLDALQRSLGGNSLIRFRLHSHDSADVPLDPDTDVAFAWKEKGDGRETVVFREAVRPVCSPRYAKSNAEILDGPISGWGGLTFLDCLGLDERWTSWEGWFDSTGRPDPLPRMIELDSYNDVLQSAAAGGGIALGWRYFVDSYVEAGALVELGEEFVEFDNLFCGLLTEKGRRKPLARNMLAYMSQSIQG